MLGPIKRYIERIPCFDPAEREFIGGCRKAIEELGELKDLAAESGAPARDLEVLDGYRAAFERGVDKRERKTLGMSIAEQIGVAGMLGVGGSLIMGMGGALSLTTFASIFFPSGVLMVPGTLKFYHDRADRAWLPQAELESLGQHSLDVVASYQAKAEEMKRNLRARREVEELHRAVTAPEAPRAIEKGADQVRIGGITLRVRKGSGGFGIDVPETPPPPRGLLG
ncbi:MAG: hypothetical protein HY319_18750 [Armatimonadetes bacterium]|nr:hypothetical protein [Armatimonadota bacterium]